MDFIPIAQIQANENANQTIDYQYVYNNLGNPQSYFQLAQVDMDGTQHEWDIITISCEENQEITLNVFPNPIKSGIFKVYSSSELKNVRIGVFSLEGKLLYESEVTLNQGYNEIIPDQKLKSGTYLISIVGDRICEKLKGIVR